MTYSISLLSALKVVRSHASWLHEHGYSETEYEQCEAPGGASCEGRRAGGISMNALVSAGVTQAAANPGPGDVDYRGLEQQDVGHRAWPSLSESMLAKVSKKHFSRRR